MSLVRVLIAEDFVPVQEALKNQLTPEYEIVAIVGDGQSALTAAAALHPDIVLLDISLPDMTGLEVARQLRKSGREIKIIFVTSHGERDYAEAAFRIGADGYVQKRAIVSELPDALKQVLSGISYRSPLLS